MAMIVLVANSNPLHPDKESEIDSLKSYLESLGHEVLVNRYIYSSNSIGPLSAEYKGLVTNGYLADFRIDYICDLSGGDLANDILPYLSYDLVATSPAKFVGYSDLTTVINAIYSQTGKSSVLYQIRNLRNIDADDIFNLDYNFIQGDKLKGIALGGNIRCFLKLAGTKYFPDLEKKVLVLESFSGSMPRIRSYFNQLEQMGAFDKISGLLLGEFSELESNGEEEQLIELAQEFIKKKPIVKTKDIGHSKDSKAIEIGEEISLFR